MLIRRDYRDIPSSADELRIEVMLVATWRQIVASTDILLRTRDLVELSHAAIARSLQLLGREGLERFGADHR